MSQTRRIPLALICLIIAFASTFAQETLKVDTTLVSVPVIVSDRQGRYVGDLQEKDFSLFQDGNKQPISFFAATEEPFNVALLLDTSHSTFAVINDIKHAAKDFVKRLRAQDRAMIVTFDHEIRVLTELTSDHHSLEKAIESAEIGERAGTVLRDAIDNVIEKNLKPIKGRKAIVLLTDGKDHGSYISERDLLDQTAEAEVLIYPIFFQNFPPMAQNRAPRMGRGGFGGIGMGRRGGIMLPRAPRPNQERKREERRQKIEQRNESVIDYLVELAEGSAGRFYRSDVSDLKKTFAQIADELRHQYRLGFYPPDEADAGKLHTLKVAVAKSDVVVRARRNYRLVSNR